MSDLTDQQREIRLQIKLDGLLSQTSVIHQDTLEVTAELTLEVNHWRNVCVTKEKELAGLKIENSELVAAVESISADRRVWEGRFNDAFTEYCEADEKLKVAKRVAWACVALTAVLFLALIYGEYN